MQQLPTWGRQSSPLDAPSAPCNTPIRVESQLYNIGSTCDVVREGRAAAFLHQDCSWSAQYLHLPPVHPSPP